MYVYWYAEYQLGLYLRLLIVYTLHFKGELNASIFTNQNYVLSKDAK